MNTAINKWVTYFPLVLGMFLLSALFSEVYAGADPGDPTWATSSTGDDFEIWLSSSTDWDAGDFVCGATLTDDNSSTVDCDSGTILPDTTYRVQFTWGCSIKNNTELKIKESADFLEHRNVKGGWAGTDPTLLDCDFEDMDGQDKASTCTGPSWSGNNVRMSGGGINFDDEIKIKASPWVERHMYTITTDSDAATDATSYLYIDENKASTQEDSSKITITVGGGADPTFDQTDYRWYVDNDGTNPVGPWGTPDIAENTAIVVIPSGNDPPNSTQELRLRVNMTVNDNALSASSQTFDLQFKEGTDGSCTTGSWTDVADSATWEFASSSVSDGANITGVLTSSDVNGQYAKSNPTTTNANSATVGQQIEYDFHIIGTNISENTQYSFRVREADDTVFDAYTNCPTLTTEPGVGDLMRHGNVFTEGTEQGFFWTD